MDPTLNAIIEVREEMRDFRAETRAILGQHSHGLNLIEVTIASLKAETGVLLGSVPLRNERLDRLEARVAALEGSPKPSA